MCTEIIIKYNNSVTIYHYFIIATNTESVFHAIDICSQHKHIIMYIISLLYISAYDDLSQEYYRYYSKCTLHS